MLLHNNTNINGIAYDWSSIKFTFGSGDAAIENTELIQITAISYGETRDAQKNYGTGAYPVSKGFGNVDVKASMTIAMTELRKLIDIATNTKIQNLESFEIVISYYPGVTDQEGTPVVEDRIQGCSIDSTYFDLKQNDMNIEVEIDLNPMNVLYGVTS